MMKTFSWIIIRDSWEDTRHQSLLWVCLRNLLLSLCKPCWSKQWPWQVYSRVFKSNNSHVKGNEIRNFNYRPGNLEIFVLKWKKIQSSLLTKTDFSLNILPRNNYTPPKPSKLWHQLPVAKFPLYIKLPTWYHRTVMWVWTTNHWVATTNTDDLLGPHPASFW